MNNKITVIGAGSFGTALAVTLTDKGYDTYIWGRKKISAGADGRNERESSLPSRHKTSERTEDDP